MIKGYKVDNHLWNEGKTIYNQIQLQPNVTYIFRRSNSYLQVLPRDQADDRERQALSQRGKAATPASVALQRQSLST